MTNAAVAAVPPALVAMTEARIDEMTDLGVQPPPGEGNAVLVAIGVGARRERGGGTIPHGPDRARAPGQENASGMESGGEKPPPPALRRRRGSTGGGSTSTSAARAKRGNGKSASGRRRRRRGRNLGQGSGASLDSSRKWISFPRDKSSTHGCSRSGR